MKSTGVEAAQVMGQLNAVPVPRLGPLLPGEMI